MSTNWNTYLKVVSTALFIVIMRMEETPKKAEAANCFDSFAHDASVGPILFL